MVWRFCVRMTQFCDPIKIQPFSFLFVCPATTTLHAQTGQRKGSSGSFRVKKLKKIDPSKKLIFCHKLSPLDWIMLIWAIFGLPGPPGGSGGPWGGFGGSGESKIVNFHRGSISGLRCQVLDLNSM